VELLRFTICVFLTGQAHTLEVRIHKINTKAGLKFTFLLITLRKIIRSRRFLIHDVGLDELYPALQSPYFSHARLWNYAGGKGGFPYYNLEIINSLNQVNYVGTAVNPSLVNNTIDKRVL